MKHDAQYEAYPDVGKSLVVDLEKICYFVSEKILIFSLSTKTEKRSNMDKNMAFLISNPWKCEVSGINSFCEGKNIMK
jgi:hypothetical protein